MEEVRRQRPVVDPGPPLSELAFPGCVERHMTFDEAVDYEGRLEFWDAEAETAWICEDGNTTTHESPGAGLPMLLAWIAGGRGLPIRCLGSTSILLNDPGGRRLRMMEPDQCVYLNPKGLGIPEHLLVVGEHDFPDVILEVDNTTDVRRGKLALYQAWGAPELWVEVPDYPYPNRPATLRPGLTIYLLTAGRYKEAGASRAFPSWTADEIHWAFNEETLSRQTFATLRRVGEGMGARSGTGPQNNPLFRWQRDEGHAQGRTEGLAEGRTEGLAAGRAEGLVAGRAEGLVAGHAEGLLDGQAVVVRQILRSRGIPVSPGFPDNLPNFGEAAVEVLVSAAQGCTSEADFAKRILAD